MDLNQAFQILFQIKEEIEFQILNITLDIYLFFEDIILFLMNEYENFQ